jgi:hypothetical protein
MGNTPSVDAPKVQTSRQPAQRPQNERPIFAGVLGETVDRIGPHGEASSLTVTPLPKDANIVVRTPGTAKTYSGQTAAFLCGRQSLKFEGVEDAKGLTHRGQVKCTITGIEPKSALAWAIRSRVGEKSVDLESMSENSIKLRARMDCLEFSEKVRHVCGTINDLRSMGLDDDSIVEILHLGLYNSNRSFYDDDIIIKIVTMGHHRLAKHCLGSGNRALDCTLIDILRNRLTDRDVDLSALAAGRGHDEKRRELDALFCLDLCTKEKPDPLQAAWLVKDHLNRREEPLPYQEMVMSCLLGAMRSPDDAPRLMKIMRLGMTQATVEWSKRLSAKEWLALMPGGPYLDPGTLTISIANDRADYIERILEKHCALAYDLICDLAAAMDQRPDLQADSKLAKLCALTDLGKLNIKLYEEGEGGDSAYFEGQKGKLMLCELSRGKEASTIENHHEDYFSYLGSCMKGLDGEVILRELLDLPEAERAELFRNPKTRHLLRLTGHPAIVDKLVKIEVDAHGDFGDKLKKLLAMGFEFAGFFGEKPIEISQPRPPSPETVDLLLDLAEAAVLSTSFVNWATGVLNYLSTQLLLPYQAERAIALFDPVRSAVRFNPDKLFVATVSNVEMLTGDAAKRKFEQNAETVFLDRLQKLKDAGIVFSGDPLTTKETESIEIEGGLFGKETVDMLLDLAELAVNSQGWTNWAVGVLSFLSDRVLEDDQLERAISLRRRIQLAVYLHRDPQVNAQTKTVAMLTDAAISELHGKPASN